MLIVRATKNIWEALRTITFPCKQTIMKDDMNKFNLIQLECRIQNLTNLLMLLLSSKYYKSITPPLNPLTPKSD